MFTKKEQFHQNNHKQSHQNNPEKLYTEKKAKHEPSGLVMLTKCSFDKQKINLIITEEMKNENIDRAMKIINYEGNEMILLTDEENKSYKEQEACHIC